MQRAPGPSPHPALLPPGTLVGHWLIVAWAGRGVHGAVYKAVPVDNEQATPVALKLALLPRDPRFEREAELLSTTRHLSVPRLWEYGAWPHPSGTSHPYLVMDWVDGAPLYAWAQQSRATSQQVLQWLAQLASALQTLHAQGCVHRDVKGDNVLVRHDDGRAVLTDFGSGIYPEAATLTPDTLPPGTPAYRSPEAWMFTLQFLRERMARYSAQPADDLYALGVTAYRLVTGEYPELAEPTQDATETWHLEGIASPAPRDLNPRVAPQLNALILRMLSVRPEERGPAAELTQALEQAAALTAPAMAQPLFTEAVHTPEELSHVPEPAEDPAAEIAQPLFDAEIHAPAAPSHAPAPAEFPTPEIAQPLFTAEVLPPAEPSHAPVPAEPIRPPPCARTWWPWLMMAAAASVALFTWAWWLAPGTPAEIPAVVQREAAGPGQPDGGSVGLGEAATATSAEDSPAPSVREAPAEDQLPEPEPGQALPDAKGRCPYKRQVVLNGACWARLKLARDECDETGGTMYQNACYLPAYPRGRRPTAAPACNP
jgi:serine/threonine protein kinase